MTMTDPIADLLARIRNGLAAGLKAVELPSSSLKVEIVKILKDEGYVTNYLVTEDGKQGLLKVDLKYRDDGRPVIDGIERVSKPGRRYYTGKDKIKPVLNGLGIGIVSTSQGLKTDKAARREGIGGEVLCKVW